MLLLVISVIIVAIAKFIMNQCHINLFRAQLVQKESVGHLATADFLELLEAEVCQELQELGNRDSLETEETQEPMVL